ncbi:hypothetical protein D9M70_408020 [compost metagenome]
MPQIVGDGVLQLALQGAAGGEVKAVEVVERHFQQPGKAAAGDADALVGFHALQRRLLHPVAKAQACAQGGIAQGRVYHPGGGQHADMAVGQGVQLFMGAGQVIGRTALGDEQREHLAHGQAALVQRTVLVRQHLVDLVEVGAVPDAQAVGDTVHLAMPRRRRERHAVEVVHDDALATGQGFRAVLVGAHAGGDHLADLLGGRGGAAEGRVAVFLQLGGQGAAPGGLAVQVDGLAHLGQRRLGEARPVDGGVGQGHVAVQQLAVLDEQQAAHQQRRNAAEARVALLRIGELVEGPAAAVADTDAGLDLFPIGREQPALGVVDQGRGETGLLLDLETAFFQAVEHLRQEGVAQAAIEGAFIGVTDGVARAVPQLVAQGGCITAEFPGLEPGSAHLMGGGQAHDADGQQADAPEQQAVLAAGLFRGNGGVIEMTLGYLVPGFVGLPYCAHSPPAWPATALASNLSRSRACCMPEWRQNGSESMAGDNRKQLGHGWHVSTLVSTRPVRESRIESRRLVSP